MAGAGSFPPSLKYPECLLGHQASCLMSTAENHGVNDSPPSHAAVKGVAIPVDRDNLMWAYAIVGVSCHVSLAIDIKNEYLVCSGFQVFI